MFNVYVHSLQASVIIGDCIINGRGLGPGRFHVCEHSQLCYIAH